MLDENAPLQEYATYFNNKKATLSSMHNNVFFFKVVFTRMLFSDVPLATQVHDIPYLQLVLAGHGWLMHLQRCCHRAR